MDEKKGRSKIKGILFFVLYFFFFTPLALVGYQLTPYIIENKSIDLLVHSEQQILVCLCHYGGHWFVHSHSLFES